MVFLGFIAMATTSSTQLRMGAAVIGPGIILPLVRMLQLTAPRPISRPRLRLT
jgi:hypothetical protein